MLLNNLLVFIGDYHDIRAIREDLKIFIKNKKDSKFYNVNTTKYIKKLKIEDEYKRNYVYELKISFLYSKSNVDELISSFRSPNVKIAHLCYQEKKKIWIVNQYDYIREYKLFPAFALNNILFDYMQYKEAAIITDSFENIKYNRNSNKIVVNDKQISYEELLDIIYNKTIKSKLLIDILDEFIKKYYDKCINSLENIYSNTKEKINNEEPSPFALFFVTFGIIGIIYILLKVMGYL